MFSMFDEWEEKTFWPSLGSKDGGSDDASQNAALEIAVDVGIRSSKLGQQLSTGLIVSNKVLNEEAVKAAGDAEKRHLEINLPSDMSYKVGDYLAILPTNPLADVKRVMKRFQIPWDAVLRIDKEKSAPTSLPTVPISAHDLFSSYVELSLPATKRDLLTLANAAEGKTKDELTATANDSDKYNEECNKPRVSPLDIMEKYPELNIPLGVFISMLPLMRIRQYSISSSPLWNPQACTLTVSVLNTKSTAGERQHIGVASNFLASLAEGDYVQVSARKSHGGFTLPLDVQKVG